MKVALMVSNFSNWEKMILNWRKEIKLGLYQYGYGRYKRFIAG